MSDIQKADKKTTRNSYLLLLIIVVAVVFIQTEWFANLVTIDKADMDLAQLYEARLLELFYAQLFNIIFLVILGIIGFRMINLARKSLREKRYPPSNTRTAIDTEIVYGKKARLNAYLMIFSSVILILSPIFRSYYLYSLYTKFDDYAVESREWELEKIANDELWKKLQDDFILANPKSPQSAYYLYQQGELNEAENLINSLVSNNIAKAIFAKHTMNIDGELYDFNKEDSIVALDILCNEYMQPCLFLANYFIEQRDLDKAFSKLDKIKHVEHPEIYSKLRWLYSSNSWSSYDKNKANKYAKLFSKASKPDCDGCTKFSLTKY